VTAGSTADLASAVASVKGWYHTIELAPGVVTPGWFDLRRVLDRLPWPELAGRRCLDVATWDGCLAFEAERRGAADVVAIDIASHDDWDHPPRERAANLAVQEAVIGEKGRGFDVARAALRSAVRREFRSVYDLRVSEVGRFDLVICGSLLLHLRDPFRALAAIREVCDGWFLSIEAIDLRSSLVHRRQPMFRLVGAAGQWLLPNLAAHRRMLETAGFDPVRTVRPFAEPYGPAHPPVGATPLSWLSRRLSAQLLGGHGVPCSAVLCSPHDDS
jgi:tRNA (mo5U34)-methyltransferase